MAEHDDSESQSTSTRVTDLIRTQADLHPRIEAMLHPLPQTPSNRSPSPPRDASEMAMQPSLDIQRAPLVQENRRLSPRIIMESRVDRPTPYVNEEALAKLNGTHPSQLPAPSQGPDRRLAAQASREYEGPLSNVIGDHNALSSIHYDPHVPEALRRWLTADVNATFTPEAPPPERPAAPRGNRRPSSGHSPFSPIVSSAELPAGPPPTRRRPSRYDNPGSSQLPGVELSDPVPPPQLNEALHNITRDSGLVNTSTSPPDPLPAPQPHGLRPSSLTVDEPPVSLLPTLPSPAAAPALDLSYLNVRDSAVASPVPAPAPTPLSLPGLADVAGAIDSDNTSTPVSSTEGVIMRRSAYLDAVDRSSPCISAEESSSHTTNTRIAEAEGLPSALPSHALRDLTSQTHQGTARSSSQPSSSDLKDPLNTNDAPSEPKMADRSLPPPINTTDVPNSPLSPTTLSAVSPRTQQTPVLTRDRVLADMMQLATPSTPLQLPEGIGRRPRSASDAARQREFDQTLEIAVPKNVEQRGSDAQQKRGIFEGRRTTMYLRGRSGEQGRAVIIPTPPTPPAVPERASDAHQEEMPRSQVNYPELPHVSQGEMPVERLDSVDHGAVQRSESLGEKGKGKEKERNATWF